MTNSSTPRIRYGWLIVIAIILALIVLSLVIPQVRASLSDWFGLAIAPADQIPATSITLIPITITSPTSTASPSAELTILPEPDTNPTEISQLSSQAGWDVLTPRHLPEGYQLQSAYYEPNQKVLILTYLVTQPLPGSDDPSLTASKTITLLQALGNDYLPMQVAPKTNVIDIQVNGRSAAYAIGAWDTEFVKDNQDTNNGKFISTWRNDLQVKNLYWQDGKIYLVLVTDDEAISQQELIDVASSVSK